MEEQFFTIPSTPKTVNKSLFILINIKTTKQENIFYKNICYIKTKTIIEKLQKQIGSGNFTETSDVSRTVH